MSLWCFHRFGSIQLRVWEEMLLEEFQDGRHLGYRNGTILAILNLYVAPMPPIKFWLNLTFSLGGDVVWRISRWPPWQLTSLISEWNDFSNSESLHRSNASHQVCPIWLMVWEMSLEECQDGLHGVHLRYLNIMILAILNLCHSDASHQVLVQFNFRFGRRCRLKNFKTAAMVAILDIVTKQF